MTEMRDVIVAIGASAGGLEALQGFFRALLPDTGMAFVVVTHLGPGRPSSLPEIIARYTEMPVHAAEDNQKVEPGHVYVLAVDSVVTIKAGRLRLRSGPADRRERNPIDLFFASLAEDKTEDAIGIVMSGGGSDGALGIKAIKERGGLTLAQGADHTSPRHDGMPSSAIATGVVDLILPAEEMPAKLIEYVRSFAALDRQSRAGREQEPGTVATIFHILRNQVGHDFSGYKERTFLRRVHRRMQVVQLATVDAYVERLRGDPHEVTALFRDLLIGVTGFFRDPEAFDALAQQVLPTILDGRGADAVVRCWVPGCATGEEAYSLAILIREHLSGRSAAPRVQIFATDIDERALGIARAGRYPPQLVDSVSKARLDRFFNHDGLSYGLTKEVRDLCVFSAHNVIRDPPFSRIDLVTCRNLLIYFSNELQRLVVPVFHYALRPGGFLFLGTAENVTQHQDLFEPVSKRQRIFRRVDRPPANLIVPMFGLVGRATGTVDVEPRAARPDAQRLRQLVEGSLLDRFAPAHVIVNRDAEILYFSARTGKYLEAPAGVPSRQLLAMTRRGLRLDLQEAFREAAQTRRAVAKENIAIEVDDRVQVIAVHVEPLGYSAEDPLYLVLFIDHGPPQPPTGEAVVVRDGESGEQLERDLRETRDRLQTTVEEYETALEELKSANEELVSVNEELQSANEELESSKEEQQSVNEELHAVNLDLNAKIEELDRLNADIRNLFEGTQIATIFLDRHLLIRSFTPAVTAIFNLIHSDRGRPLTDIVGHLEPLDLPAVIQQVLDRREPLERPVSLRDGRSHFMMRILPYRGANDAIEGVLLTFVDVTQVVQAEQHQRMLVAELNHRVRNMLQVVSAVAAKSFDAGASSEAFAARFMGRLHALADAYELLSREGWTTIPLDDLVNRQLSPHARDDAQSLDVGGPPVSVTPRGALALGMVVHELATNAAKYGALSRPGGRVTVRWELAQDPKAALVIRWLERGGPEASTPGRRGFGTELIERQVRYDLDGEVVLELAPEGLAATLRLPLGACFRTTA
jgi:two-component system CheB/CheR fusion protein